MQLFVFLLLPSLLLTALPISLMLLQ